MSDPRDDLTAFERSLSGLAPSRAVARDRLMYESGRRAGLSDAHRGWRWPAVAAAFALTTLGQGLALSRRPAEIVVERVVHVPAATTPAEPVVVLTRRDPQVGRRTLVPPRDRPRTLAAGSRIDPRSEAEPPLISVVYLGPLDSESGRSLSPRHGRTGDPQSLAGGPL